MAAEMKSGMFCWNELATNDVDGAKAFYSALLGWEFTSSPMPGDQGGEYIMISKGEQAVGGLFDMTKAPMPPVPPHWMGYVAVDDVDASAATAQAGGAVPLFPPMDIPGIGRMCTLRDPQGACVSLYKSATEYGEMVPGSESGGICWHELMTNDADSAAAFYSALFPWTLGEMPMGDRVYRTVSVGDESIAGIDQMGVDWHGIPPHWLTYISVDDCDAAAVRAEELGGAINRPPADVPNVGRFAVLTDPAGALFAIIQLG